MADQRKYHPNVSSTVSSSTLKIKIDVLIPDFQYLWLKYVNGFDPTHHCARCLKGHYSHLLPYKGIASGLRVEGDLNEYDTPFIYLCGVTARYENNLHLPFEYSIGEDIFYQDERIRVTISNAKQLPIAPLPSSITDRLSPPFYTCRNYQFGWMYFNHDRAL